MVIFKFKIAKDNEAIKLHTFSAYKSFKPLSVDFQARNLVVWGSVEKGNSEGCIQHSFLCVYTGQDLGIFPDKNLMFIGTATCKVTGIVMHVYYLEPK